MNTRHRTWSQRADDGLKRLHALPEHHRKMFAAATTIAAGMILIAVFWISSHSLENVMLESVSDTRTGSERQSSRNTNQLGSISSIAEMGPMSSFLESFRAAKDLLIPKEMQENPMSELTSNSWQQKLSGFLTNNYAKARMYTIVLLDQSQKLLAGLSQRIMAYTREWFGDIFMRMSRTVE